MKRSSIFKIVIYALLILVLTTVLVAMLSFNELPLLPGWNDDVSWEQMQEEGISLPTDGIREIEIQWVDGSIVIENGDTDAITFRESVTDDPMVWGLEGDKLVLQFSEKQGFRFFGRDIRDVRKDLIVTLPRDYTPEEVEINSVSANVQVTDLTAQEVSYHGVSAKCDFENCTVEELSIQSVSGNVSYTGSLLEADCEGVSNDCVLNLTNVPREIELEAVSGDLKMLLPEGAGFTAEIETVSGKFSSDFATTQSGDVYRAGDGACSISVSGMSGSITVNQAK